MSRSSRNVVMLLLLLLGAGRTTLAATVSATATLTVSGAEQPGDAQNITVSFNGFLEVVHYGQYSTPASLAAGLAAMFTRDYHRYGLYAKAGTSTSTNLNVITFQLIDGQTFGSISCSPPTSSFTLTPSGFGSSNSVVADSGTVTLTVNGGAVSSTHYGDGATPESIALGLATSVSSQVNVTADGGLLYITSKTGGSSTNYPYSLSITHDSADFTSQSFQISPMSGNLTGGANQTSSGAQVYSYTSRYDGVGNVTAMSDSVMGNSSYTYDNLNRVATSGYTSGTFSGQYTCWSYDSFGNRTNQATSNAAFTNAAGAPCTPSSGATYQPAAVTVDAGNHLTTTPQLPSGLAGSSGTLSGNGIYDLAGNVINDGVNQYLYDAEGRVCAVQSATSGMIGYQYDADGARVGKGTITSMSCDITSNGYQPTADYVLDQGGAQMDEIAIYPDQTHQWVHTNVTANGTLFATYDTTGLHFYLNDPLGTRRAQTNQYGVREQTCQSLPFGDSVGPICSSSDAAPTEQHFTGKERDTESGLDYFGGRYYASAMGRFSSPDPGWFVASTLENPQTWNQYSYVLNNPLNRIDPDGYDCVYLNDAGNGVDRDKDGNVTGVDNHSDAGECKANKGYWVDGTATSLTTYSKTNEVALTGVVDGSTLSAARYGQQQVPDALPIDASNASYLYGMALGGNVPGQYVPNIATTTDPQLRLFGTHWCGPGGGGSVVNALDAGCKAHDECFDAAGISAASNSNGGSMNAQQTAAAKKCNAALGAAAARNPGIPGSTRISEWLKHGDQIWAVTGGRVDGHLAPGTAIR